MLVAFVISLFVILLVAVAVIGYVSWLERQNELQPVPIRVDERERQSH